MPSPSDIDGDNVHVGDPEFLFLVACLLELMRLYIVTQQAQALHDSEPLPRARKKRRVEEQPRLPRNYAASRWAVLLEDPSLADPSSRAAKEFRRSFRLPYPVYLDIVKLAREEKWYHDQITNVCGQPMPSLELMILGVLRVLGGGYSFNNIREGNGACEASNRNFFHMFCRNMAKQYPKYVHPPTSPDEIFKTTEMYRKKGFPGCIASCDCVHIPWDKCPDQDLPSYKGKEKYPTIAYQVCVDHSGKALSITSGFPGTFNDKTIARYDSFLQSVHQGTRYAQEEFDLYVGGGRVQTHKGLWIMVDQGYHRWRVLQCPLPYTVDPDRRQWSRALESCRKDVECFFGRLKSRFRCVKIPCNFWYKDEVDNMFITCCILQNIILAHDAQTTDGADAADVQVDENTEDEEYEGMDNRESFPRQPIVSSSSHHRLPLENDQDLTTSIQSGWMELQSALILHYKEALAIGAVEY